MNNVNGQQAAIVPANHGGGSSFALFSEEDAKALEPKTLQDAVALAETFASVSMCGVKSMPDALGRIMNGRSMGLSVMQSLQGLFTFDGNLGMYARTMHALCLNSPLCEYFDVITAKSDATKATCRAKRVGRPEKEYEFTIEDAVNAQLLDRATPENSNWVKWVKAMLIARCIAALARIEFPDVIFGMRTREEMEDDGMAPEGETARDPNEMQGEIISTTQTGGSPVQAAKRDYAKEADKLIADTKAAFASGAKADIAKVRADITAWDGIDPWKSKVATAYNTEKSVARGTEKVVTKDGGDEKAAPNGAAQVPAENLFSQTTAKT